MESNSVAVSRRAAQCHARAVATGPPRYLHWTAPAACVSAVGAAVAVPSYLPAALALTALAVLLLVVHRDDRRNAWRYVAEPVPPARLLPPLRPAQQAHVIDVVALAEPDKPIELVVEAVHVPTQPVPLANIPAARVSREGVVHGG